MPNAPLKRRWRGEYIKNGVRSSVELYFFSSRLRDGVNLEYKHYAFHYFKDPMPLNSELMKL